jgi:hypothetical protein
MVLYISRADDPDIPPPYDFPGITIMSFRLPAMLDKLQALCDQFLNIGDPYDRGFEYRALLDFVDMEIVTYPKMLFGEPPYDNWGFAKQHELYFRFFVWKFVYLPGGMLPEPVPQLFFPYICVDNSWSAIAGRNVIGFPKVMAQFQPAPALNANPFHFSISILALETLAPTTELDWKPIVEIDPGYGPALAPTGNWPWIGLPAASIDPLLNQILNELLPYLPDLFSTVQLKQFRDASNTSEACYQSLLKTPFTPSNIGVPTPLPPVTIKVKPYGNIDIPASLGIGTGALQPLLQYAVTLDMSMGKATTLFVNS